MRYPRLALALAAAGCVLAIAAAPALGATKKEFYGTPIGGKTKGLNTGIQELRFGPVHVFCGRAVSKGVLGASPSPVFNSSIRFSACHTEAKIGAHPIPLATTFLTPLVVEYHHNGFVETGSETVEEEGTLKLSGGTVELRINAGPAFKCEIRWPEQILPFRAKIRPEEEFSAAIYTNVEAEHAITKAFPEGKQDRLLIENFFKGINFEYVSPNEAKEIEEAEKRKETADPCSQWGVNGEKPPGPGPIGHGGRYFGAIEQQVTGGELEFRSAEEEPF
jgi:hypothetical protein